MDNLTARKATKSVRWLSVINGLIALGVSALAITAARAAHAAEGQERVAGIAVALLFATGAVAAALNLVQIAIVHRRWFRGKPTLQGHTLRIGPHEFDLRQADLEPLKSESLNQIWPLSELFEISRPGRRVLFAPSLLGEDFCYEFAAALREAGRAVLDSFVGPSVRPSRFPGRD